MGVITSRELRIAGKYGTANGQRETVGTMFEYVNVKGTNAISTNIAETETTFMPSQKFVVLEARRNVKVGYSSSQRRDLYADKYYVVTPE